MSLLPLHAASRAAHCCPSQRSLAAAGQVNLERAGRALCKRNPACISRPTRWLPF